MATGILKAVLAQYRESRDFNGLYFDGKDAALLEEAVQLVRDGLLQVVGEEDYPNPHIRPWPSRRTTEAQIDSLEGLPTAAYGVCLYPTPEGLKANRTRRTFPDQPFRRAMAAGRGTLELAYFRFDVLEQYRNDPKFTFEYYDFGARAIISDEAYLDETEAEHEKIIMDHIGFAYDLSRYDREDGTSPIVRLVCAFYGDLAKLSPVHQQRWKTYQIEDEKELNPHPVWWAQQMGHWPDGMGPFERFFFELRTLNTLHNHAFGQLLFKTTDRPRDFGWILRPSQHEWDSFVHQLDKLLSDNLRQKGLDAAEAPRQDADSEHMGTIRRLGSLLERTGIPDAAVRKILAPLREVREARQAPAHELRRDFTDNTFIHKQVELMERVNEMLDGLRNFWQTHPANRDWVEPNYISEGRDYRM